MSIEAAKRPHAARRPTSPRGSVTDDELAALDALGKEGVWQVGGDELKLTNLDKALFERGRPPVTKRELIRYFARIAPTMLPHLADRPLNLQRFPNGAGAPGFWQKDIPGDRADLADPLARDRRRRPRGPRRQRPPHRRPRRDPVLARQPGELRDPRLDRAPARAVAADLRLHRHRPGRRRRPGRRPSSSPGCTGPRSATSACAAIPRRPASAASRSGSRSCRSTRSPRHQRLGREGLAGRRVDRAGPRLVGVGEGRTQGPGPARLHPEREHQDAGRAVCRPAGARRARSPRRSPGTSWTTRTSGPTAGRSGPSSSASPSGATCSPPPRPTPRSCPTV